MVEISNEEAEVVKASYALFLDYKLNYDEINLLLYGEQLLNGVLNDRISGIVNKIQKNLKIMIYTEEELKKAFRDNNTTEIIEQIKIYREQLLNKEFAKDLVNNIDELLYITEKNDEISKLYDSIKDKIDKAKLEILKRKEIYG